MQVHHAGTLLFEFLQITRPLGHPGIDKGDVPGPSRPAVAGVRTAPISQHLAVVGNILVVGRQKLRQRWAQLLVDLIVKILQHRIAETEFIRLGRNVPGFISPLVHGKNPEL